MASVVVLGGCGGIGSVVVRALATAPEVERLVVADLRRDEAVRAAAGLGHPGASGVGVDLDDPETLDRVLRGADVVVSCVGPFYRYGPPALRAAIAAGVDYVDVCDDLAPTLEMLALHDTAREAGVHAVVGMGNSPGVANVFARLCADQLLDQVESVDIMHIHGGEPDEGAAVLKHRIAAMTSDVPLFVDGGLVTVRQLEPSGERFVQETEFRDVGTYPVHPYPHPETVTLPRHLPGLRRVTNLGVVFPLSYFRMTQDLVRAGACTEEPVRVGDLEVQPIDVAVALLRARRPRLLAEAGVTGPAGCLKVVVGGRRGGEQHSYVFQMSSQVAGAGEGTGIPAAIGALLLVRDEVAGPGVLPPEAAIDPGRFLELAAELMARLGLTGGSGPTGAGPTVELTHVHPDGTVEVIPLLG
ncbi:MAG: saccharopine dehydrogenase NADP-binding domain-containing protein [Acidimicrobiales bacterium]|nr:saccharopine dehydrogenase NADP-binding domain-containing protein [Acidimicrobiales bacterium]